MIKSTTTLIAFLLLSICSRAQINTYLAQNTFPIEEMEKAFDKSFYQNQVFFFGFVHGSEAPQEVDFQLLHLLHKNGVKYYAPEVDQALAYFLNFYLETGDEEVLKFIVHFYNYRVPQDASLQFKNKWRELYQYNQDLPIDQRIKVLGFDVPITGELTATYLAHLVPDQETGLPFIDSLKYGKNFNIEELNIRSGKPIMKSGKPWSYFFGGLKTELYDKLVKAYKKDSTLILEAFGENRAEVQRLLSPSKVKGREQLIYENFKVIAQPLLNKGEKVYCNYGYYHIQQNTINNRTPFAAMIKQELPYKLVTIQGTLFDSECFDNVKLCFDKKITLKGVELDRMNYCGYKTSKTLDGDSFFERLNGHQLIRNSEHKNSIVNLVNESSPFRKELWFADFSKGGKNWKIEEGAITTDYFQYLIVMKNSKANIPYQEEK